METGSREESNALAFMQTVAGWGGCILRPPNYLTLQQMQLLELRLGQGQKARDAMDPASVLDEMNVYLFLQAAPLPDVARAVRSFRAALASKPRPEAWEDFLCAHVEPFLASLAPEAQAGLREQLGQLGEIDAARVDAEPPAGHKPERPHPNC